ncbi:MAG: polysaccharide biosynthesis/export family protein [bacterium]
MIRNIITLLFLMLISIISFFGISYGIKYVVGPDDILHIELWGEPMINGDWIVSENGNIDFPLLGRIKVAGLTIEEITDKLNKELLRYYRNPQTIIKIVEYGYCEIYVLGEVRTPGVYHYKRQATALEAILMAGGFTKDAKRSSTMVIRNIDMNPEAIKVNMDSVLKENLLALNVELQPGDIIYVPRRFISNINQFLIDIEPSLTAFIRANSIYRMEW